MNQKAYDMLAFIHKLRTDCMGVFLGFLNLCFLHGESALQLVRYRVSMTLVGIMQISGDGDSE